MVPTVLITRPAPAATDFAERVRARVGQGAVVLTSPVMEIVVRGPLPEIPGDCRLVFTSRNGVAAYAELGGRAGLACYTVGDATARAAQAIGLRPVSAGADARALADRIIEDGVRASCLHMRGEHVAGNLAEWLRNGGVSVREHVVYQQTACRLAPEARAVLNAMTPVVLPLFSPRTGTILCDQGPFRAPLLVAAISRNAAAAVAACQPHRVDVARRPDAEAVLDLTEELVRRAKRLEGDTGAK
ncbi:uroporphyrinogen-III synthase [Roseovarius salinarum]|uniref:uroporphyrinogen-III synthase n=1 Tax=Roseovarius salinarum TaxID=1981892 RepID=UPI000C333FD2|nr:uroporphyrinogen-III synthase [Roseovarius salinarum]